MGDFTRLQAAGVPIIGERKPVPVRHPGNYIVVMFGAFPDLMFRIAPPDRAAHGDQFLAWLGDVGLAIVSGAHDKETNLLNPALWTLPILDSAMMRESDHVAEFDRAFQSLGLLTSDRSTFAAFVSYAANRIEASR